MKTAVELARIRQRAETYNFCLSTLNDYSREDALKKIRFYTERAWAECDKYCMDDMGNALDRDPEECMLEEARDRELENAQFGMGA